MLGYGVPECLVAAVSAGLGVAPAVGRGAGTELAPSPVGTGREVLPSCCGNVRRRLGRRRKAPVLSRRARAAVGLTACTGAGWDAMPFRRVLLKHVPFWEFVFKWHFASHACTLHIPDTEF